jgi:hypothetical protein
MLAVSHLYGIGSATLVYGAEGSLSAISASSQDTLFGDASRDVDLTGGRIYADLTVPIGKSLQVEGGAHGVVLDGGGIEVSRVDPRIGIAFTPMPGQWLRAAYRRDGESPIAFTLSPVATVGLLPGLVPLDTQGSVRSTILRWESEWGAHLFTTVEYQHQAIDGMSIPVPQTLDSFDLVEGRIDRVTATANVWIGGGFGLFATGAYASSEGRDAALGYDGDLPYLPDRFARVGLTWVSPAHVKVSLAQNFVGGRVGVRQTLFGFAAQDLPSYTTTDLTLSWEPFERRLAVEAALLNAFDTSYDVGPEAEGPGRTVLGSVKVRF